jgi:diaminohydroxyphosphoribosylaminopyrimidine deaminase/5-amino-6-(5-phosphoribosylamino)uracil reductase
MTRDEDERWMAQALALAEKHRGRTAPNPIVGCVIVARGKAIASGAHAGPGKPHAEIVALKRAGARARGATMYVTLEPCMHHGRTPPCAPVVRAAALARVVVGSEDPVPGHGGGIEALRRGRISVSRALVAECDAANRPFFTWAMYGRPAFTLKAAVTLDGKIATVAGQSRWITGEAARADVHRLRDTHDAVLVGVGTVLADDPRLTARLPRARDPVRIVLDGRLRTPVDAQLLPRRKGPRTIIATSERAPETKAMALERAGAEVWRFPTRGAGKVPLDALARRLGDEGLTSVLVEGGGEVHAGFLAARLADEVVLYVAPKVVGGPAPSWVGGAGLASLAAAYGFRFDGEPVLVGHDLRVRAIRVVDHR